MTASVTANIRERVQQIETMPAIPAVFLPLLKLLSGSAENVNVEEVVSWSPMTTPSPRSACGWRVRRCSVWRSRPNPSKLR